MNRAFEPGALTATPQTPAPRRLLPRILLHGLALVLAAAAFVAHQHFKLAGQSTLALVSLVAAGVLALAPIRALVGEIFSLSGHALHAVHGIGGLLFVGLAAGGVFSGSSLLNHAAMAPFAIMGAAQAVGIRTIRATRSRPTPCGALPPAFPKSPSSPSRAISPHRITSHAPCAC
jgi:hypothetical protein